MSDTGLGRCATFGGILRDAASNRAPKDATPPGVPAPTGPKMLE
jgi:hypothetical protein